MNLEPLHPWNDVTVVIKTTVKDLGEKVNYDKSVSLGFIREKIDEAVARMNRLEWLPATLQTKAKMLQSCVGRLHRTVPTQLILACTIIHPCGEQLLPVWWAIGIMHPR